MKKVNKNVNAPVEAAPVQAPAPTPVAQPMPAPAPAKKSKLGLLIIPLILLLLVVAGIVAMTLMSSPKAIFTNSINRSYKDISNYLKESDKLSETFDIKEKALYLKGDLKLSTNIKDLVEDAEVKDIKIAYEGGIDLKHEELIGGLSLVGDKSSVGGTFYYKEKIAYVKTTFLDKVYKMSSDDSEDLEDIFDIFEEYEEETEDIDIDPETYDYLIKTIKDAVIKSLDSKSMEKSKGTFEVDGKTIKANKVSYILTEDSTKDLITKTVDILLEDDEFIGKLADATGLEKKEVKEELKDTKDEAKDIDLDGEMKINLYTKGLFNKVVGFSVEQKEKEYLTYFKDGKVTEIIFDNHDKEDPQKLVITAVEDKDETEVTIKLNKEKLGTITIREFSEEAIDFDFEIEAEGEKVKGTILLTGKQKKSTISGEYKFKLEYNDEYVELSGEYSLEADDKLKAFEIKDAVPAEDLDDDEALDALKEVVEKDDKLNALLGDLIEELENPPVYYDDDDYDSYDSNDMLTIYTKEELEELMDSKKTFVLYVGSTYYSKYYTDEADQRELLTNLVAAQVTYNFHSYRMPEFVLTADPEIVKDTYKCKDTTKCVSVYPAIYFIKNGEIKRTLRGKVTASDIKSALQEIGMAK